jgi:hypothetical protein
MALSRNYRWYGPQVQAQIRKAAARGLLEAGEYLKDESDRLVPLEEGTLRNSGEVSTDEGKLTARVSYDTPYAVRQHEETTYRHPNGRQAKYLEQASNLHGERAMAHVSQRIKAAAGE